MAITLELPSLGESVIEGTVSRWLVAEGDFVEVDQPIVEVTTDKVDAEIPSPSAGTIEKILVAEGDVVEVGAALALIDPEGRAAAGASSSASPARAEAAPASAESSAPAPATEEASAPSASSASAATGAPAATPVARRMAAVADVPLDRIEGSGSGGRITKADVVRATQTPPIEEPAAASAQRAAPPAARAAASAPASAPASPSPRRTTQPSYASYTIKEGDRVIPMSPMRRITAEHMVFSKRTSPHVGTVAEIDMGGVYDVRQRHKRSFEETNGFGLTFLPFIVHSVVRALREYPALNASVLEDAIVEKRDINIGLAVETEKGLVVPVVRQTDRLSLAGLAAEIDDVATRARNRKLTADDLQGGTFTVSNPGRRGNLYGFAIINQPQVGIVRMGEMVKRPVVRSVAGQDAIVIRPMMHLALSYDHRAVDGAAANGFLWRIRELLETADFDL